MIKNDVLLNEEIDPKLVSEINLFSMEENRGSLDWKKFGIIISIWATAHLPLP